MINLKNNERVDWFRITVDLNNDGISVEALAKMAGVARSTIQGWRYRQTTPIFDKAVAVLNIWSDITGKDFDQIPVYDPYKPE